MEVNGTKEDLLQSLKEAHSALWKLRDGLPDGDPLGNVCGAVEHAIWGLQRYFGEPAAVIEPEPPKCRTCEGVGLILGFGACPEGCAKSRELYREKWEVIDAVREIRSRKGDK